jgi:hypothetical protein
MQRIYFIRCEDRACASSRAVVANKVCVRLIARASEAWEVLKLVLECLMNDTCQIVTCFQTTGCNSIVLHSFDVKALCVSVIPQFDVAQGFWDLFHRWNGLAPGFALQAISGDVLTITVFTS